MSDNATPRRYCIGGDFEISRFVLGSYAALSELTGNASGTWTINGRAALRLVLSDLRKRGVKQVELPAFLCDSIIRAVEEENMPYTFYPVDADLRARPSCTRGSAVLLVHYFGWLNPSTAELRSSAGSDYHLIEDCSQALLSDWKAALDRGHVVLSPRKFAATVMTGWCNVEAHVSGPSVDAEALVWRSLSARLIRAHYLANPLEPVDERIETLYLEASAALERHFDSAQIEAAPDVLLRLAAGTDWPTARSKRRENWLNVQSRVGSTVDLLTPALSHEVIPLGYVVRLGDRRDDVRRRLAADRVFTPIHWPLPREVSRSHFPEAARLAEGSLTLPIDQRYGDEDMTFLADRLAHALRA